MQQQHSRSNINCDQSNVNRYKLYHGNSTTIVSALKRETRNGYQMMVGDFGQLNLGPASGDATDDPRYHLVLEKAEGIVDGEREDAASRFLQYQLQHQQQPQQQQQHHQGRYYQHDGGQMQMVEPIESIDEAVYSSSTGSSASSHSGNSIVHGNVTTTTATTARLNGAAGGPGEAVAMAAAIAAGMGLPVGLSPPNESLLMQRRLSLRSRSLSGCGDASPLAATAAPLAIPQASYPFRKGFQYELMMDDQQQEPPRQKSGHDDEDLSSPEQQQSPGDTIQIFSGAVKTPTTTVVPEHRRLMSGGYYHQHPQPAYVSATTPTSSTLTTITTQSG